MNDGATAPMSHLSRSKVYFVRTHATSLPTISEVHSPSLTAANVVL